MYNDLSDIQLKILNLIKEEITFNGYPPSVREIGDKVGLASTSSVHYQLSNLEKKGYIKRDNAKQRAIEVVDFNPFQNEEMFKETDTIDIPIIGNVAAGTPILAEENIEDTFPLPSSFIGTKECFFLNVKGESMINAGILDGDLVLVKRQRTASDGEMIVALIEDEATVKTFYRETNRIRLQPENPLYEPIYANNVEILGKVIGVIRMMD